MHVNDLLDEDIRDFTRREFADFIAAHGYDSDVETQLIELVASALKQNPRRIKQFINGLELRLEILGERKAAGRIQIDPQVLVVAKLAIIEEQWTDRFDELKANPRKLTEWHAAARRGRDLDERDEDGREPDHAWNTFLRFTEQIRTPDLRPYLTLQQSQAERDLPRYRDFVEALENGRVDALDALFEDGDVSKLRDEYLANVVSLLRHNVSRGYYGSATNIVRASVEAEALSTTEEAVLTAALPHPALRSRLGDISFSALLEAADRLDDQRFNQVAADRLGEV